MNSRRIYLSKPHLTGKEHEYVLNTLDWIEVKGDNILGFENDLECYLQNKAQVAAVNSGTSALHLALVLLDVQSGDEVICQTMTFTASANPIVYRGALPIFVDSETDTWNMCPIALEAAIQDRLKRGKKPKAIIAVHLYGMPYKHTQIQEIALKYEIPIIEDAAEALGSSYDNQKCGTLGDISILSFNGNKIITTSGGGALVSKKKEFKEKTIFLATQAREKQPYYHHKEIGYNYRMNNISAGIGRAQMLELDNFILKRREINCMYKNVFENIQAVELHDEPNSVFYSNHWLSAIRINPNLDMSKNSETLRLFLENANIESRPLWKPMHLQPVFKSCPYYGDKVAESVFYNGLCLPSSSNLTDEEKIRIVEQLQFFFQ